MFGTVCCKQAPSVRNGLQPSTCDDVRCTSCCPGRTAFALHTSQNDWCDAAVGRILFRSLQAQPAESVWREVFAIGVWRGRCSGTLQTCYEHPTGASAPSLLASCFPWLRVWRQSGRDRRAPQAAAGVAQRTSPSFSRVAFAGATGECVDFWKAIAHRLAVSPREPSGWGSGGI